MHRFRNFAKLRLDCCYRLAGVLGFALLSACGAPVKKSTPAEVDSLNTARHLWFESAQLQRKDIAARNQLRCAVAAWHASESADAAQDAEAQSLADHCTRELLGYLLDVEPTPWRPHEVRVVDEHLHVVFRDLPDGLDDGPVALVRADEVTIPVVMGQRYASPGYGVAMVGWQPHCQDKPICTLDPPEGVTRALTAWIEPGEDGVPRLVVGGARKRTQITIGHRDVPLAMDFSATYAALFDRSHINRLAVWNLIGGKQFAMREGLYLLQDYDPDKTPIIMVHGLGRSPMVWAKLTNLIDGDPALRARYQIWHVVYPTNTPLLLNRLIVQRMMDRAWRILDPDKTAPARHDVVMIGHSMGGVVSRLLVSQSDDVIWHAVFDIPPEQLRGSPEDIATLDALFRFFPYPGVTRAFFLASPHMGSPYVDNVIGWLALHVVHAHAPELDALQRVTKENRAHENPLLIKDYERHGLSSISTLRAEQPVSHAASTLLPVAGVRYYTFAGDLPGSDPPSDGFVPLKSALLPGATSTTVVKDGHQLYLNDEVLAKIVEILRQP